MATETMVANGVVKGKTVVLDEHASLPEGARVTVELTPAADSDAERRARLYRRLEAEGTVTIPRTPPTQIRSSPSSHGRGKPLSQTIIEDRR